MESDAFQELSQPGAEGLGRVMSVPVEITVELARRRIKVSELLRTRAGSSIDLHKLQGDPLEIRVNDRLIARGAAVAVGDMYGIQITEVVRGTEDESSEVQS